MTKTAVGLSVMQTTLEFLGRGEVEELLMLQTV